jgi:16S rRNA (guanine527-N7)-methyltransferase
MKIVKHSGPPAAEIELVMAGYGPPPGATEALQRLLTALAAEVDPPTKARDPASALDQHVADSLAALDVAELAEARRIADLGSGAGFPGLPLAIMLPGTQVDLVESAQRKCAVIERLLQAARIENARVVRARAEEWAAEEGSEAYDAVTARALAPLPVVLEYAAPLLREGGSLVVWHGARDAAKEATANRVAERLGLSPGRVRRARPFEGAHSRHLHVYSKVAPTPAEFPRRPGMAAKRPLR